MEDTEIGAHFLLDDITLRSALRRFPIRRGKIHGPRQFFILSS